MRNPKLAAVLFLLQGASLAAAAAEIEVGNRLIIVPEPAGFVELTPQMSPYYETMYAYIVPTNVRYLTLVENDKAEALLRGEDVELSRYMIIESEKVISETSVSTEQFNELRGVLRNQIEDMYASIETQLPELIREGNEAISKEFAADFAVQLGGLVPMPIHLDTERSIANSMYMTVGGTVNDEDLGSEVLAATTLFLHIKDKVIFLYVYGDKADLEWTRGTAEKWSTDIAAANPLTADEQSAVEASRSSGINWSQVLDKALVGAFLGGVIALISIFLRKRRKS